MVTDTEIEIAADAMRDVWDHAEAESKRRGVPHGLSWLYLAEVALNAAVQVRGKPAMPAPEKYQ
jgi:hypothetical protein